MASGLRITEIDLSSNGLEGLPPGVAALPGLRVLRAKYNRLSRLPLEVLARHYEGLDLVEAGDRRTACFIGGYGRRYVGSGSFLRTARGVRRFSPPEVARLLGLPEGFRFPAAQSLEVRYRLLGNGLSIPVAAWALQHLA